MADRFCVMTGQPADADGVCPEHGETACVVGALPGAPMNDAVDRAIASLRVDWLGHVRDMADRSEALADSVRQHDEACADSMLFVALRLRRVADRVDKGEQ